MNIQTPVSRTALRAAIARRDVLAGAEREAAAARARADGAAADAKSRLASIGDVDAEIRAVTAAAYATAAQAGVAPAVAVPEPLAAKRRGRDAAAEQLAAAQAAVETLTGQHLASKTAVEQADRDVTAAADAVMGEAAMFAHGRYVLAIREARAAWDDVVAIAGPPPQTVMFRPSRLPDGLVQAVARGFGSLGTDLPSTERYHTVPPGRSPVWDDLRERLRTDPDATLGE